MDSEKLFDLSGKLALITGASRGIGAEAAKTLARFGARVILSSRKREGLDGIAQEITEEGFEAMVRPCHNGDRLIFSSTMLQRTLTSVQRLKWKKPPGTRHPKST